ncbi:MAG TPA: mechanosensitive ion channel family protein [Thermotogota bacterium]|nr:mechanosensitive ion channel family protein [Thermotogota bacterium]HRW91336.1 mechanosensitive ion channel family protein [Thermotogota bacterium]
MGDLFQIVFFGNSLGKYFIALIIFFAGSLGVFLFQKWIQKKLKSLGEKKRNELFPFVGSVLRKTIFPMFYYGLLVLALNPLVLPETLKKVIDGFGIILLCVAVVRFVIDLMEFVYSRYQKKHFGEENQVKGLHGLLTIGKILIWALGFLAALRGLGVNVTGALAGLGITGIAVALAAQTILADLFSYFSILFDKPFEPGDFIITGSEKGTIEHIGIKTTRLRSLSGEQLIISNSDLTNSRVQNYKRMQSRRINFAFGVTYDTPRDVLQQIPQVIESIVRSIPNTRFDRCHFASFGDFSLNFDVVYYVEDADYRHFMDIQQQINLEMKEKVEALGAEFAFPTQTIFTVSTTAKE